MTKFVSIIVEQKVNRPLNIIVLFKKYHYPSHSGWAPIPLEILVLACTFIQTFTGPALQFPIALLVAGMDIFWSTFVSIIFSDKYTKVLFPQQN